MPVFNQGPGVCEAERRRMPEASVSAEANRPLGLGIREHFCANAA
jgi:hypothetical protein